MAKIFACTFKSFASHFQRAPVLKAVCLLTHLRTSVNIYSYPPLEKKRPFQPLFLCRRRSSPDIFASHSFHSSLTKFSFISYLPLLFLPSFKFPSHFLHPLPPPTSFTSLLSGVLETFLRRFDRVYFLCLLSITILRRCSQCNDYHCRKLPRRHKFKSWTRVIAFSYRTYCLGESMNPTILPPAMGK